ncbi:MAG: diguanylate cyclase [Candidatus Omnitrophica bacterium]|nr:diguanylate cyclase [Candidatus Omnitrophota bacterium]
MNKKMDRFSLGSRTIKQKLIVAFQLMSILPLLVCAYLVSNYILPKFGFKIDIVVSLVISAFVAIIGLLVIKEIFDRLSAVTSEAKVIAAGDISHKLDVQSGDEVGELSNVLNQLTNRIRGNMDELKAYSEKTSEINLEIQKKIFILSNLLQVSSLISQGEKFDDILKIAVEKSRLLANSETAFLLLKEENNKEFFYVKAVDGAGVDYLMTVNVGVKEDLYNKVFNQNKLLILDKQNLLDNALAAEFFAKFQVKNCLSMPIFLRGKVKGALGIVNSRDNFLYSKEDIELLDIFSKQIAIAIENDILAHRIEKMETKDILTGLYNQNFITSRLQEEIRRAIVYQRPCAFVVFDIDNFKSYREKFGLISAEVALKKIAVLVNASITEVDRAGRTGDDEFSLILPERNKRQAHEVAEEIRKKIQVTFSSDQDSSKSITLSGGVAENPLDGVAAEQLINKARELLKKAKADGKNKVVAF